MATMVKDKVIDQAADSIDALAERAKEALYSAARATRDARGSIDSARDGAWRIADQTRAQASGFAGEVLSRGTQTAQAVGRRIEERPWVALVVVGFFGLVLGYALRGR